MDANLVPLMMGLLAAFLAGMGYIMFSAWRMQRAVAWNVVQAVLTLRQLPPEQKALFEQGVADALKQFHLSHEQIQRAEPAVRYALYADAMRRQRIMPPGESRPFKALRSPRAKDFLSKILQH